MNTTTALVTGANRGIGLAIAKGLAEQGHTVLLGSRNAQAGEKAAAKLSGEVIPVTLNLSDRDELHEQLDIIKANHPQIGILVNNAGVLEYGNLLELAETAIQDSMRVNFEAPMQLIRTLAPRMMAANYGRIVNLSSGWGSFSEGLTGPPAYAVSKAALNALTLSLSHELPNNVKVNALCPGWVRTRMGGMGADRSPEQGAETALWLANLPSNGPTGGFFRDKRAISW